MPKVILDPAASNELLIYGFIQKLMDTENMTQTDLANEIGMSQQKLSYKLKNRTLSIRELIQIFSFFRTDASTIGLLMRVRQ